MDLWFIRETGIVWTGEQVKPVWKALLTFPLNSVQSLYLMILNKCPDYKVSKPFSPPQKRSQSSYQSVFLDCISSNQSWVSGWRPDEVRIWIHRLAEAFPVSERMVAYLCVNPVTDWQSVPFSVISDAERTSRRKWMDAETAQPDAVCDFTAQAKTLYSLYNCIKLHKSNTSVLHTWSACSLFCLIALLI